MYFFCSLCVQTRKKNVQSKHKPLPLRGNAYDSIIRLSDPKFLLLTEKKNKILILLDCSLFFPVIFCISMENREKKTKYKNGLTFPRFIEMIL